MVNRTMKDSKVNWIGDIPDNWEVKPLKYIANIQTGNTPSMKNKHYYSDNGIDWVKTNNLLGTNGVKESEVKLSIEGSKVARIAKAHSTLVSCIGDVGKMGYITSDSAYNQQINAVTFNEDDVFWKYGMYYISVQKEQHQYYQNGNVLKILNTENQKRVVVPVPKIEEQQKIATFLDEKVSHIDTIIEDTKKSIENLKAYKQSLITETVTKGLDPNVEMKDSGIDWIGEIPAHWNIMKLSYLSRKIGDGIHSTPNYDDSGNYYFINGNNFYNKSIIYRKNTQRVNDSEFDKFKIDFDRNTIFISLNGTIGNLAYYNEEKIILGKSAGYIKIKKDIDRGFIYYYLLSAASKTAFDLSFAGTTINNLSLYTLRNLKVTIPSKEEQVEVSMFLDKKTQHIDLLINQKEKIINELESYKKSLIYEYVTGKKEVK